MIVLVRKAPTHFTCNYRQALEREFLQNSNKTHNYGFSLIRLSNSCTLGIFNGKSQYHNNSNSSELWRPARWKQSNWQNGYVAVSN